MSSLVRRAAAAVGMLLVACDAPVKEDLLTILKGPGKPVREIRRLEVDLSQGMPQGSFDELHQKGVDLSDADETRVLLALAKGQQDSHLNHPISLGSHALVADVYSKKWFLNLKLMQDRQSGAPLVIVSTNNDGSPGFLIEGEAAADLHALFLRGVEKR